ncbi:class I SAM-dependent methyltransferase [Synechococcus sp. FGCU-3]|nr:class I SAM-dependent methyltransferase [Synechococcus sp. FGCU3]
MNRESLKILPKARHLLQRMRSSISSHDQPYIDPISELLQGGWAIGEDDVEIIEREVERYLQCAHISILEFGSGASTLVFLRYLVSHSLPGDITSVECDPQWINRVESCASKILANKQGSVKLSIVAGEYNEQSGLICPSIENGEDLSKKYDIIFIDSPPDNIVEDGRLKLSSRITKLLDKRGTLLIHDTSRSMELYAFKKLSSYYLDAELCYTGKGMGILRFPTG